MNIKVSEIVASYLEGKNLGAAEYSKVYSIAIWGWRELNWDITGRVRTVPLCLSSDYSVTLPDDFLNLSDFGIPNGEKGISSFDRTDDLQYCGCNHSNERDNVRGDFRNSDSFLPVHNSLGVGSYSTIGFYKLDVEQRKIFVHPDCQYGDFLLKYLSYNKVEGEYEINELAQAALKNYIRWQVSLDEPRIGEGERLQNERRYYNEKRKAKLRIKKLTVQELNKAARESEKLAIKS